MSERSVAKGNCLCGAVTLSTTSMNPHVAACHCNMCRKWGGGTLMAVECSSDVNFEGEENIGIYQSQNGQNAHSVTSAAVIYFTDSNKTTNIIYQQVFLIMNPLWFSLIKYL